MAEEIIQTGGNNVQNQQKRDYSDYQPLEINLGVFFSTKALPDKTTLSLNYTRGYIRMVFTMMTDSGKKEQVFKKFTLSETYRIVNALDAILADRLATLNNYVNSGASGPIPYSELPEDGFTFQTHYYDKEKGNVPTGKITISTVDIEGTNRVCIKGYSETEMLQIRTVFFDDINDKLYKASKRTIVDSGDLDLYRFVLEIKQAISKTFEYACADKIYQAVIWKNRNGNSGNFQPQQKKFGFFNKNTQRQVSVNDSAASSNESGVDLFDNDEGVDF